MKLTKVTITGIDDTIRPDAILPIAKKFPFVEWGILVRESNGQFHPRFPSNAFLNVLEFFRESGKIHFSLHVCGKWVRDICKGRWTVLDNWPVIQVERIQLNFSPYIWQIKEEEFLAGLKNPALAGKQIIFQMKNLTHSLLDAARGIGINAVPFVDNSGGKGKVQNKWPQAVEPFCGFAGGLSPLNLEEQLQKINEVAGDIPIWIDVETGVRNEKNEMDLDKVWEFLLIAERWMNAPIPN